MLLGRLIVMWPIFLANRISPSIRTDLRKAELNERNVLIGSHPMQTRGFSALPTELSSQLGAGPIVSS